ncbi:MAG: dihydrolipoamide acetyltransferase family protein [Gemmatimonadota bacterium]
MAKIEVPMPQMGESIAEGTVSKWLKKPGDTVERDEPILEISTDKVDAEIPAPAAGTLAEVAVEEGQTVEVGTVVAYIETEQQAGAEAPAGSGAASPAEASGAEAAAPEPEAAAAEPAASAQVADGSAPGNGRGKGAGTGSADGRAATAEERLQQRSTPLVRRIAAENGIDLGDVEGTGRSGRVTKQDIMAFLDQAEAAQKAPAGEKPAAAPAPKAPAGTPAAPAAPKAPAAPAGAGVLSTEQLWDAFYGQVQHPEWPVREADRVEPMDRIRRLTADHMILAKRIAAHVHSFIEIDFTHVARIRSANRARWEQQGVKVSYTAFVAWAAARVLQEFPRVNGTVSGENLIYRGNINLGMAVDLDPGLIVPVIRDADELTLVGISKRILDLAGRARDRKLKPEEIQGATFSITNPGVFGTYVGMPIIPEGTAAILGLGSIEKRPVVLEVDGADTIAIRYRSMFSLGYDHRIVDGADAARFLARLKEVIETFPEEAA